VINQIFPKFYNISNLYQNIFSKIFAKPIISLPVAVMPVSGAKYIRENVRKIYLQKRLLLISRKARSRTSQKWILDWPELSNLSRGGGGGAGAGAGLRGAAAAGAAGLRGAAAAGAAGLRGAAAGGGAGFGGRCAVAGQSGIGRQTPWSAGASRTTWASLRTTTTSTTTLRSTKTWTTGTTGSTGTTTASSGSTKTTAKSKVTRSTSRSTTSLSGGHGNQGEKSDKDEGTHLVRCLYLSVELNCDI